MATKNSCTDYELTIARIPFWDGPVRCDICPCMETYARKQCRLTGEYLGDTKRRGYLCPLIDIEKEDYEKWASLS